MVPAVCGRLGVAGCVAGCVWQGVCGRVCVAGCVRARKIREIREET